MVQLKDVIHLYLGCEVTTGGWMPKVKKQECEINLLSVDWERQVSRVGWFYPSYDKCIKSEAWEIPTKDIKPILRKLSDMTEEEAIFIAKIVLFENYHGFTGRAEKYNDRYVVWDKGNSEGDHVEILFDGQIVRWVQSKVEDAPYECCYEIFPYLLSHHFDLFNLISSSQAIDKETLTTKK